MRRIARTTLVAATVVAAAVSTLLGGGTGPSSAQPGATASTFVPFSQTLRRCDFSVFNYMGGDDYGRATAQVRTEGGEIVADLQFATGTPNARYDVRLLQVPRSSALPCNVGDPAVASAVLITDATGAGTTTVRGPITSGATGAWVSMSRPSPLSQFPVEFYTSDFLVAL